MLVRPLPFNGYFESDSEQTSETLQIVEPQDDFETQLLSWAILPHGETVDGDSARRDYVFNYDLGPYEGDGLFRLYVSGRDASRRDHQTQIAAALVVTPLTLTSHAGRNTSFAPFWFISKRLHYKPLRASDPYPGPSYGHLTFGSGDNLPQRRLFGIISGASGQSA